MADFRKWFSVLAVVALMVGFGVTASAQPVTCNASAGSPPILRAEGYTELAGDILLTCTTGTAQIVSTTANPYTMSVQLFATTNITSRLLTTATTIGTVANNATEALMLVSYAPNGSTVVSDLTAPCVPGATCPANNIAPGVSGVNAFRALKVSDTSVVWQGVPITPPGTNFTIRLTNIRVNATTVPPAGNFPGQVSAFLAISGTSAVTVNNPTQIIGAVQTGLAFAVRNCGDTDSGNPGIDQCSGQNNSGSSNITGDITNTGTLNGSIRFTEGFAYAFKPGLANNQDPSGAGTNYNSESGYVNSTALGTETGFASFGYISQTGQTFAQNRMGTRLIARFTNVPAGVRLFVSTLPCVNGTAPTFSTTTGQLSNPIGTGTVGSATFAPFCGSSTVWAQLLQGTDANGYGGSAAIASTSFATCGTFSSVRVGLTEVTLDPLTGSGFAVWEVQGADPRVIEAVYAQYAIRTSPSLTSNPPTPGSGTASVYGTFGPAYASGADKASATLPVPRFIDKPSTNNLFTINVCQTTLLFPFVTTAPGFDTGIALANTSLDANNKNSDGTLKNSNAQQGACLLFFWQNGTLTAGSAKTGFLTPVVPAGSVLTFSLFNGVPLSDGTTQAITGFNGYMIAQCSFKFAHGFAFISDLGAQKLAQGYLGLVMNSNGGRTSGAGENYNN